MEPVASYPAQTNILQRRSLKLDPEVVVALAGTVISAILLLLTAINAGPLWRDEVNTANVAQMPSFHDLLHESFPPLWLLLLRGCNAIGIATSDAGIRVLGLYVGLAMLGSLWLSTRWIGCRAPTVSIALLGVLPTFILIMGANRAYGLATCLLTLSFGAIWRLIERPSRGRVLTAGIICFLFAHCAYSDVFFLAGLLTGAGLVTLRRHQWKALAVLTIIGGVSAGSMAIYWPVVREGQTSAALLQWPDFSMATLWNGVRDAVTPLSSGAVGRVGQEIWFWIGLGLAGLVAAGVALQKSFMPKTTPDSTKQAELAIYCAVSMVIGIAGQMAFLYRVRYWMQPWYYTEMLCLCSLCLDGLLGANWSRLRPWGLLRIGLMVVVMAWYAKSGWEEAHTRRSNVDLIAATLAKDASDKDLIVVPVWEGITFNRYYHGRANWATVPPIGSHLVHRNDLVLDFMNKPGSLTPLLQAIIATLQGGHSVWLLGNMSDQRLAAPPSNLPTTWVGTYFLYWNSQITFTLLDHASEKQVVDIPTGGPVFSYENLPLVRFEGHRASPPGSAPAGH